jgi:hypothetical protein
MGNEILSCCTLLSFITVINLLYRTQFLPTRFQKRISGPCHTGAHFQIR